MHLSIQPFVRKLLLKAQAQKFKHKTSRGPRGLEGDRRVQGSEETGCGDQCEPRRRHLSFDEGGSPLLRI